MLISKDLSCDQLRKFGVTVDDVTWSRVTMTTDAIACIRQRLDSKEQTEQIVIVDISSQKCQRFPFRADSAMVSPTKGKSTSNACSGLLAFKVGDQLLVVKMDGFGGWHKLYSTTLGDVQYWTWLNADTIGLVTDHAVFHWLMQEAEVPRKVFTRHQRLDYMEITSYKCDPHLRWCALTGLMPQADCITGETQLYSLDKRLTQCIRTHSVLLTTYLFLGNQLQSTVLCAAGRDTVDPSQGKVHVVEFDSNAPGNLAPWSHYDIISFTDSLDRYDFPVSLQVSSSNGLLFVVTKYAHLYLCDIETATCLYSASVSASIIFATVPNAATSGIFAVNTSGQVLAIDVNLSSIVRLVQDNPHKRAAISRLEKLEPLIPVHFLV